MKYIITLSIGVLFFIPAGAQTQIIFRADDMGFSHAANAACIDTYKAGLVKTVEVIVPGPWFEEAVQLVNAHPDLDVGVHLALTSEWSYLKWRPLTHVPSLVDDNGYFFPMIWPNDHYPGNALKDHQWKIDEVEQELRAQIELAIKRIPRLTHFTGHMGCTQMTDEVKELADKLAIEYNLIIFPEDHEFQRLPSWTGKELTQEAKFERLEKVLNELKPGKYLTVTHPAYETEETRQIHHIGYPNVAADRDSETKVLTDPKVKELIDKLGIEVIGYHDVK